MYAADDERHNVSAKMTKGSDNAVGNSEQIGLYFWLGEQPCNSDRLARAPG